MTLENRGSFGDVADAYRDYRPRYPRELYAHLAALSPRRERALDCATGNGQAAVGVAELFARVAACDFSEEQIARAVAHERVDYAVAPAESLPYDSGQFDLITVAQGAHWFDLPAFYAEVRRVARPNAVLAIWGYAFCEVEPVIDGLVERHLLEAIAPYWADGNRVILDRYRSIEFPFTELEAPELVMEHEWDRSRFLGYVHTWSATRGYVADRGSDPTEALAAALASYWPDDRLLPVRFALPMRIGRIA